MISQMGKHRLRSIRKVSRLSPKVTALPRGQSPSSRPRLSFPPLATLGMKSS